MLHTPSQNYSHAERRVYWYPSHSPNLTQLNVSNGWAQRFSTRGLQLPKWKTAKFCTCKSRSCLNNASFTTGETGSRHQACKCPFPSFPMASLMYKGTPSYFQHLFECKIFPLWPGNTEPSSFIIYRLKTTC